MITSEKIIELFEAYKENAEVICGFSCDLAKNNDKSRQILTFIVREFSDYLYLMNISTFSDEIKYDLLKKGQIKIVEILQLLNCWGK
jgi:hypothetical protein